MQLNVFIYSKIQILKTNDKSHWIMQTYRVCVYTLKISSDTFPAHIVEWRWTKFGLLLKGYINQRHDCAYGLCIAHFSHGYVALTCGINVSIEWSNGRNSISDSRGERTHQRSRRTCNRLTKGDQSISVHLWITYRVLLVYSLWLLLYTVLE